MQNVRRTVWLNIGFIALISIVFGVALYFMDREFLFRAGSVYADRSIIQGQAWSVGMLAVLKQAAPEAKRYEERLRLLLPAKDELLDFPRRLDGVSRAHQVSQTFSFRGNAVSPQGNEPGYIGFTIDAVGSYTNVVNFFRELEVKSTRFLVSIDSLDISRSDPQYRARAEGKIFFR